MPSKKTAAKKAPAKKTSTKTKSKASAGSPLLAHFPHPPPAPLAGVRVLPKRGEPGSWDDEFERLPDGPAMPSLLGSHWMNAKKQFWRFEPDGKLTFGAVSGGLSRMEWRQKESWVFLFSAAPRAGMAEFLARFEGDALAGYHRSQFGLSTIEYGRVDAEPMDEFIRASEDLTAWLVGPRDRPQPPSPTWSSRAKRPAAAAAMPALRFSNHRPAKPLAAMTSAEQKHLAAYADTIAQQAEFGHVEVIDLLDAGEVAYHLYWWPFTDGVLVDAGTGAVVADLLNGSIAIDDGSLRARVEAGYRDASGTNVLPKSLVIHVR